MVEPIERTDDEVLATIATANDILGALHGKSRVEVLSALTLAIATAINGMGPPDASMDDMAAEIAEAQIRHFLKVMRENPPPLVN